MLRHSTKKPGCKEDVMAYFAQHPEAGVTRPEQIAVVGDRLSTDVMMANLMGGYGIWVRDGVQGRGFVSFPFFVVSLVLRELLTTVTVCEDGG